MREIREIAREIRKDWGKVHYAAAPYLRDMAGYATIDDSCPVLGFAGAARSCVKGFLANAGSWRGEVARRVKAELKGMI